MFLFIFETIGTQELVLIGIIALIFLGPRKLPEYAKKIGKIMAEFRGTANEFKQTWEREVNFEEESKAFQLESLEREAETPVARNRSENEVLETPNIAPPAIRSVDPAEFDAIHEEPEPQTTEPAEDLPDEQLEKHNWL